MSGHSNWRDVRHHRDSAWRCPMHGRAQPKDDSAPVCPITIRRTIAGKVEVGVCGQALEPFEEEE